MAVKYQADDRIALDCQKFAFSVSFGLKFCAVERRDIFQRFAALTHGPVAAQIHTSMGISREGEFGLNAKPGGRGGWLLIFLSRRGLLDNCFSRFRRIRLGLLGRRFGCNRGVTPASHSLAGQ